MPHLLRFLSVFPLRGSCMMTAALPACSSIEF